LVNKNKSIVPEQQHSPVTVVTLRPGSILTGSPDAPGARLGGLGIKLVRRLTIMQPNLESPAHIGPEVPSQPNSEGTFLPPVERPNGVLMKLVYAITRRRFGKVLTPLKVFSARMPVAFAQFYGKISALDKKLVLPPETAMLIREQVARNNVCLFCIDIGRYFTIKASMNQSKFDALAQYPTSPLFSDAERAALDYVTELTRNKRVDPETFARLARHYSERQICEIVWLVASEHFYNMTNIGLNIHSDMLCALH
jgi:alkylhydroperoxidase family enzyme